MDQPVLTDLFVVEVEQLPSVAAVNAERDRAIQQVAQHAEEQHPGFSEEAAVAVVEYLLNHGPTSGEQLTLACKAMGIVPPDDRAFGSVYLTLSRRGLIVRVGEAKRLRGHNCNGGSIWDLKR